jgi:ubiquinone/menaquinone biosynthesis C-methylase UbiE
MFESQVASILAENERRRREIPADFYSAVHPHNLFMASQRRRSLLRLLRREGITSFAGRRILEVGCGAGGWLLDFVFWGAMPELLCGIDIDKDRLAEAARNLPAADLRLGNASELPWPDAFFDVVLQATVFTSILDSDFKRAVAAEMIRVVKPDGLILWYDFRFDNPWNPHVRGIGAGEMKRLFPGCSFRLKRVTLLPPLARRIVPVSWIAALILEKIPLLRTHILACIRPPRAAGARASSEMSSIHVSSRGAE